MARRSRIFKMPAIDLTDIDGKSHGVGVFNPWLEGGITWGASPTKAMRGIAPGEFSGYGRWPNDCKLAGQVVEFKFVAKGATVRALPDVERATFLQFFVIGQQPSIALLLREAAPAIRAAIWQGLAPDHNASGCTIGDHRVSFTPDSGAWSVQATGHTDRSGQTLKGLPNALGAISDGVFAVRLIEAIFSRPLPKAAALDVAAAIDQSFIKDLKGGAT